MNYEEKFINILKDVSTQATLGSKTSILDSMEFVTLIVSIEEDFGIEFGDEALNPGFFSTLRDVYEYAMEKMKGI